MDVEHLDAAVRWAIVFSGVFLWTGMLTGVWKYWQIRSTPQARAHYYVDIAHRSSLLYAPASLILAVLAYFSVFSAKVNLICVLINLVFFSFSILSYILHGFLKDTSNQFKKPHQLGAKMTLPSGLMSLAMFALIAGELGATGALLLGSGLKLLS
ncbi:hypothetical protein [Acinetobacter pragensis]|uniref:Uncharacterized protein n=1 Tax=Acinetobacter pragensis TaxID=1806892 RepID=A0A151XXM0_9GAMM|nr:hypothetical protein [Acinetobacter pragensis]KYQ70588.1 hypothetical protein AZH43_03730 [Acinetobacter pragensis]